MVFKARLLAFTCMINVVWRTRNEAIFEGASPSVTGCLLKILEECKFRVSCKKDLENQEGRKWNILLRM